MFTSPRRLSPVLATAVFLGVVLFPTHRSDPSVVVAPPPPSSQELRLTEDLALWVQGDSGAGFRPLEIRELAQTVRDRRQSFELFRRYNGSKSRERLLRRLPYGSVIVQAARANHLDSLLLAAVVEAESHFDPRVVSSRGALGLMQLMPETAAEYGTKDPLDPRGNVEAGARYLRDLLARYQGDLELALAAYNAGPGNVSRYGGMPPFPETTLYVDKVLAAYIGYHRSLWQGSDLADMMRLVAREARQEESGSGDESLPMAAVKPDPSLRTTSTAQAG